MTAHFKVFSTVAAMLLVVGCSGEEAGPGRTTTGSAFGWVSYDQGCSGAFVEHGLFVSAKHCYYFLTSPEERDLVHAPEGAHAEATTIVPSAEIEQVVLDPNTDVAAIRYPPALSEGVVDIPPIELATGPPEETRELLVIGFPDSSYASDTELDPEFADAPIVRTVSSDCVFTGRVGPIELFDGDHYETDCAGWFGNSGGPVVSETDAGYVLWGVVSHTFAPGNFTEVTAVDRDEFGSYVPIAFSPIWDASF